MTSQTDVVIVSAARTPIGSFNGASALWMLDQLKTFGVDTHIWSLDVVKVTAIEDAGITFLEGSGREPEKSFPKTMLEQCPHPWLVVEDADHTEATTRAVLNYFHPFMQAGDYFVVEDGLTSGGTRRGLGEFIPKHAVEYLVDPEYCDFFGYNATWCVNGFLKRK